MSAERMDAAAQRIDRARRRRVTCVAIGAAVALVAGSASGASTPVATDQPNTHLVAMPGDPGDRHGRVVVLGCPSEDSCRIDYRMGRNDEPIWVVRRQVP